jgi:ribose/xylose/arabinose/galactoside ABC-type transport system permease subunit
MKTRSVILLLAAEVAAMSLWFVSSAILPEMLHEAELTPFRQAALSSGVQLGFVLGALVSATSDSPIVSTLAACSLYRRWQLASRMQRSS